MLRIAYNPTSSITVHKFPTLLVLFADQDNKASLVIIQLHLSLAAHHSLHRIPNFCGSHSQQTPGLTILVSPFLYERKSCLIWHLFMRAIPAISYTRYCWRFNRFLWIYVRQVYARGHFRSHAMDTYAENWSKKQNEHFAATDWFSSFSPFHISLRTDFMANEKS